MANSNSAKAAGVALVGFILLSLLAAGSTIGGMSGVGAASAAEDPEERPNVVMILSDDQTLRSVRYMPRTENLIGAHGATFPQAIASWPLCCPSRATIYTGQYPHNHGVLGNKDSPLAGFKRFHSETAMPVWLEHAGYYTAHIGKYLNGYEQSAVGVPPGWSEWHGSKDTYKYYGYKLLEDGELVQYGNPDEDPDNPANPASYSTDVYTDKAVDLIERRAPETQPFFLSLAYLAPHSGAPEPKHSSGDSRCAGSAKPAKRHIGAFGTERIPAPPNFNEVDVSDKPAAIRNLGRLSQDQRVRLSHNYRCRAESLLAIDEGVRRIMTALRESGELDNTLVIYTSDNGFFHGEHRIASGKNRVYEEAITVPLLMRGPGIPEGETIKEMAVNTDLAATIADVADAEPLVAVDGRSLMPLAEEPGRFFGREVLLEQFTGLGEDDEPPGVVYSAVRTQRFKYVENATGEVELYDLDHDPRELENLRHDRDFTDVKAALAGRLAALRQCAGTSCELQPNLMLLVDGITKTAEGADGSAECLKRGSVSAKVPRAEDEMPLSRITFRIDGKKAGVVTRAPFEATLPAKLLRGVPRPLVSADAQLLDGRLMTVSSTVDICI